MPHFFGSCPSFSKYSWKLKYTSLNSAPAATSLVTESATARYAPWNGLCSVTKGSYPQDIREQSSVCFFSTEILWTIAWIGVCWYFPPNGISTVPAPIWESKRSLKPLFEQQFKSSAMSFMALVKSSADASPSGRLTMLWGFSSAFAASTVICFSAPLVFKKARLTSTIFTPFQVMVRRGSSFTTATLTACRFSSAASSRKRASSFASTQQAIRSWDSLMASSVPSKPSYFFGTAFKSMSSPSASSPIATDTPPAPKSLQRFMRRDASAFLKSLWSFLSSGAFPFWTSAPQFSTEWESCALEEPVAPPMPSRPVLPPSRITTSPGAGTSRRTFAAGAAAITAPISMRFAA